MIHNNINEAIRTALATIFPQLTIPNDKLAMKTIRAWPLQDDPTQVAPYVTYGPHPKLGKIPRPELDAIGGETYFWTYWRLVWGTPKASSREQSYNDVEEVGARIEQLLQANYTLNGLVSLAGGEQLSGNSPSDLIVGSATRIYGGENEFYGEGKLVFRYSFARTRNW